MNTKRECICSSVTLKVFWVIHSLNPDKRKHVLTRHAECDHCACAYKDISERAVLRDRQQLVASIKAVSPELCVRYPFLKRYLKRTTSA